MLNDDDRDVVGCGHVDRSDDVGERLPPGRVLNLERSVEVLLLDIDDNKGTAGRGQGGLLTVMG
jgi:hypothetical protein